MDRFHELNAFMAVVEAGGFSAAARRTGDTQSAVTAFSPRTDLTDHFVAGDRGLVTINLHWKHDRPFNGLAPTGKNGTSVENFFYGSKMGWSPDGKRSRWLPRDPLAGLHDAGTGYRGAPEGARKRRGRQMAAASISS